MKRRTCLPLLLSPAWEVVHAAAGEPPVLRIWGPAAMSGIVQRWTEGFRAEHPEIRVEARLMGSDTAVPGLYSGQADIALLGREPGITDENGFLRPKGYRFTRYELMGGSLDMPGQSPALAALVDRDLPLQAMTLAQLAQAVLCAEAHTGRMRWGDLGATGSWAARPVRVFLPDLDSGTGRFFVQRVTRGSYRLDWTRVSDFKDQRRADGSTFSASAQCVAALRSTQGGLALAHLRDLQAWAKPLALASSADDPFVLPTRDSVAAQRYPLARRTCALIDRPPGQPIKPQVLAFLRHALGEAGQRELLQLPGYLPLPPEHAQAQLGMLG